ncbi:MAG: hypothetical protein U5R49_12640 [Deltaproteobacteria bacterium]|nr:hypothetical protein [Deltaproteobacteria bacterium]
MTLFRYRFPERARQLTGFQKALHDGYNFASARRLYGHGMEGDEQRMTALRILKMGQVFRYLIEHVDQYPKLRPLYNVLIKCKEDIAEQYFRIPKQIISLHESLSVFPDKIHWETTDHFIWRPQCNEYPNCLVIVEAPYANPPRAELDTDTIANEVALRQRTACVLGRISKKFYRYTGRSDDLNQGVISEYRNMLRKILKDAGTLDDDGWASIKVLHIIIRGIKDRHWVDVEISTRNGRSCSTTISDSILKRLEKILGNNMGQWRPFVVQRDQLFSGGSPYLELNRNGEEEMGSFSGFGEDYNAMEIRISKGMRKTYFDEVIDGLCELIEYCQKK